MSVEGVNGTHFDNLRIWTNNIPELGCVAVAWLGFGVMTIYFISGIFIFTKGDKQDHISWVRLRFIISFSYQKVSITRTKLRYCEAIDV